MQAKWQDYEEVVTKIAKATYKKWMVGAIDFEDMKQEIWSEFFDILRKNPNVGVVAMKMALRDFSVSYKRKLGDEKFAKRMKIIINSSNNIDSEYKWKKITNFWWEYLKKIPKLESVVLRYYAQGCSNSTIANVLGSSERTVRFLKQKALQQFKYEVENSLDIEKEF